MNEIKLILLVAFCAFAVNLSLGQETALMASCGEGAGGKCVGSAYCRACTNCSRCGHCGSGGSCGVCSTTYRKPQKKRSSSNYNEAGSKKPSKSFNLPDDNSSKYYLKSLVVKTAVLNLRNGPGTSYTIMERLKKDQELTFLAMTDTWVKVKVNKTKTIGFVFYKHVLLSIE